MTKTIITLIIAFYSLARLAAIGILYYLGGLTLPGPVLAITIACSLLALLIAGRCYLYHLAGANLRLALLVIALGSFVNMILLILSQPGALTNADLLISGTVFDLLFFIGSCTIKIRDSRGKRGKTPFSRAVNGHRDNK